VVVGTAGVALEFCDEVDMAFGVCGHQLDARQGWLLMSTQISATPLSEPSRWGTSGISEVPCVPSSGIVVVLLVSGHHPEVEQRFLPVLCSKSAGRPVQVGAAAPSPRALPAVEPDAASRALLCVSLYGRSCTPPCSSCIVPGVALMRGGCSPRSYRSM
jgi:hypothetical protein